MYIRNFRIQNYKSFADSGGHPLFPGFNVIIGQNNSGKTALIEALSLAYGASPHKGPQSMPQVPLNPTSQVIVEIVLNGLEIKNTLLFSGQLISIPVDAAHRDPQNALNFFDTQLFQCSEFVLRYAHDPQGQVPPFSYPSHQLFSSSERYFVNVQPNLGNQTLQAAGMGTGDADTFGSALIGGIRPWIYCFRAERLNIGSSAFGDRTALLPDASNLAEVLNSLQGRNPARFARINRYVSQIFPTIRHVAVRPAGGGVHIVVWSVDVDTEREDLAIPLSESGTGIGQVLAILYVTVTADSPRVIIIDEPNTFLHPAAVRKLFAILREGTTRHQYILTTHSSEVIAVAEPEVVYLVRWDTGQSSLERLNAADVRDLRRALVEVGVRLSDVFGADAVIWVEGPTEQVCFPKILRSARVPLAPGNTFVALLNTGDLEARRPSGKTIWEIYERISSSNALMPRTIAFSLDREVRSQREIGELERRSNGRVKFLPRRTYENYLIDCEAIAVILSTSEHSVTPSQVEEWLQKHGHETEYIGNESVAVFSTEWLTKVHGARLLADLFDALSEATQEYRKMVHSIALTDWLLSNRPDSFGELARFLGELLAGT